MNINYREPQLNICNRNKAYDTFSKAAHAGISTGMFNLGFCYEKGYGCQQDFEAALYWYDKAIEKNSYEAMIRLAIWYLEGIAIDKDLDEAFYWLDKAQKSGGSETYNIIKEIEHSVNASEPEGKPISIFKAESMQQCCDGEIAYLYEYFAGKYDKIDYRSENIVYGFKEAEENSQLIELIFNQLYPLLNRDFAIAVVPPSKVSKQGKSSCHYLARMICKKALQDNKNITDASGVLVRTADKASAHKSRGERTPERAMMNVEVFHSELIRGKDVLVLDDVTTSGSSIVGASQLLKKAGARSVVGCVIGRTVGTNSVDRTSKFYQENHPIRRGFIFDLDGTLFDTSHIKTYRDNGRWDEALILAELCAPSSEILVIMNALNRANIPCAIVTRSRRIYAEVFARKLGITNIVAYEDVKNHKNKSEAYEKARAQMGIYEACITVVGDDEKEADLKPAKELDMITVQARWFASSEKSRYADYSYDKLSDFIDALGNASVFGRADNILKSVL